jgi:hypothetical protein
LTFMVITSLLLWVLLLRCIILAVGAFRDRVSAPRLCAVAAIQAGTGATVPGRHLCALAGSGAGNRPPLRSGQSGRDVGPRSARWGMRVVSLVGRCLGSVRLPLAVNQRRIKSICSLIAPNLVVVTNLVADCRGTTSPGLELRRGVRPHTLQSRESETHPPA